MTDLLATSVGYQLLHPVPRPRRRRGKRPSGR